jgi:hypothetical protein
MGSNDMGKKTELAMEGQRFFDLVRWGIADEVLNAHFEKESTRPGRECLK